MNVKCTLFRLISNGIVNFRIGKLEATFELRPILILAQIVEPIFDYQFCIIIIGDSTVGKRSLLKYFTDGKFAEVHINRESEMQSPQHLAHGLDRTWGTHSIAGGPWAAHCQQFFCINADMFVQWASSLLYKKDEPTFSKLLELVLWSMKDLHC